MKTSQILASCALALLNAQACSAELLNNTSIVLDHVQQENTSSILAASLSGEPVPFTACKDFDNAQAGFTVNEISLSPNPPIRGQDLDITISGDLRQQMDKGAKVRVGVWKFGLAFVTLEFDWCTNIQGLTCPVQPGNVTFSKTQNIDSKIPAWTYLLSVETFNQAGDEISCLQLKTKVEKEAKKKDPKGSKDTVAGLDEKNRR